MFYNDNAKTADVQQLYTIPGNVPVYMTVEYVEINWHFSLAVSFLVSQTTNNLFPVPHQSQSIQVDSATILHHFFVWLIAA